MSFSSSDDSLDFLRATFSLRCEFERGGDGDRLDDELVEEERALDLGFTGFFVGSGDDADEDEEEDDERAALAGSFFRAFIGLRLCFGDGERRRSRRLDEESAFDLSLRG